jgi:hypothetical protein
MKDAHDRLTHIDCVLDPFSSLAISKLLSVLSALI